MVFPQSMVIVFEDQRAARLVEAVGVLAGWQHDEAPMQLHPGDLGWHWQRGREATVAAVRTWSRDGAILAIGMLDGPSLLRVTTAPQARRDEELARQVVADITDPQRGVLPAGQVAVEAPSGALVTDLLAQRGWAADEPWTPLRHDLAEPVEDPGVRIEVVGLRRVGAWAAVHRAAFGSERFTEQRWHAMAEGPAFADSRWLIALDEADLAVAPAGVWSAGRGRAGLIEPMGVHPEHRGRGHGRGITVAAAAALREMGSSSVMTCTPSANVGAVATYASAGLEPLPERWDRARAA